MFWFIVYQIITGLGGLFLALLFPLLVLFRPKTATGIIQKLGCYPHNFLDALRGDFVGATIWVHAVSVGEFNALRPVIDALIGPDNDDFPVRVVLTTTTKTANSLAQICYPALPITYFPLDFWPCVQSAFQSIKPQLLVLAETELWPNVLMLAKANRCKVVLANARLSDQSFQAYRRIKPFMAHCLSTIDAVLAQSDADATRYELLGGQRVQCLGNLKFDRTPYTETNLLASSLRRSFGWFLMDEDPLVLVFASTFKGEEASLFAVYNKLLRDFPSLKLIIVPRHPERLPEVQALANASGLRFSIRSQLNEQQPNRHPVVIVDTIGELNDVYHLATIAVVCGSFTTKRRGQNPLEPLRLGVPTVFGPHMENFKAVVDTILMAGVATQVSDYVALGTILFEWLSSPKHTLTEKKATALALFQANGGTSSKTVTIIRKLLSS
jgi:3-deoxy-D-manno-octulosonic-acid transferase